MEISIQHPDDILQHITDILAFAEDRKLWLFTGDIGAGKTTTIQRICSYFKVEDEVTSPSYSLVNEYRGTDTIYHIDLYRLTDIQEALSMGIEEYLYSEEYCFIEWPQLIEPLLEELPILRIHIETQPDLQRKILFLKNTSADE